MKIAILADSHNNWNALKEAIGQANDLDCDVAFFAGDLVRPKGVDVLSQFSNPVHMILGNNEYQVEKIHHNVSQTNNVIYHGEVCDIERKGYRIFMHHYPEPVEKKAKKAIYDLCIHGHLHEFRNEQFDDTRVINPGALTRRGGAPKWATLDTESNVVTSHTL